MTNEQQGFLESYYKAMNSGNPDNVVAVMLAAKRMWDEIRTEEDKELEKAIREKYNG